MPFSVAACEVLRKELTVNRKGVIVNRSLVSKLAALALGIGAANVALAQDATYSCPSFDVLAHQVKADGTQAFRVVNRALSIVTGTFNSLQFTNLSNQSSVTLPSKGANLMVDQRTGNYILTGHWVLISFPEDIPPGPSIIEYSGKLVLKPLGGGFTEIVSFNGKVVRDICALLE